MYSYGFLVLMLLLMVFLIYLSGWFSGTETAFTNLTRVQLARMKKEKKKNVKFVLKLKKDMDRTLVALLVGNNIINITLSAVAALVANSLFQTIGVSIAIGVITFLIVVFGEITPKSKAISNPETAVSKKARTLYYITVLLYPLIEIFMFISMVLVKLSGTRKPDNNLLISDDNIKNLVALSQEEGGIKKIEKEIIYKVFKFGDGKIKHIMVPMSDVFCLKENHDIEEAARIMAKRGFTRVPVMNKQKRITGVLYSKDLLGKTSGKISSIVRKPFVIYFDEDITHLFEEMRRKKIHIAIVKNRKEKHIGIVTLEDILEELVGDIMDEYYDVKSSIR